ncbi:CHASE2 domain-containing protein, partial [bacterium]
MMRLKMFTPSDRTIFVLLGIVASLIVIFLYWAKPRFLVEVDLKALDAMFTFKKPVKPTKDVVIVAVDERSVKEVGRWPWTRKKTAALIRRLKPARVVAVDIVYSEPESKEADIALQKAIAESGNVVLGYFFRDDASEAPSAEALAQINKTRITLVSSIDQQDAFDRQLPLVEFNGVEANVAHIGKAAAGFGVFNIIPQEDGMYRVSNLVFA